MEWGENLRSLGISSSYSGMIRNSAPKLNISKRLEGHCAAEDGVKSRSQSLVHAN